MASQKKPAGRVPSFNPAQAIRQLTQTCRTIERWPAWILVRWEDAFLYRRTIQQIWELVLSIDPSAERVVLYPKEAASLQTLFQEITSSSLFASSRLIVAHVSRPLQRTVRLDQLARELVSIPDRTMLVLGVDGMSKLDAEMEVLSTALVKGGRGGMEIAVWKPYNRQQYLDLAREILGGCGVRTDDLTLNFWIERLGSNLDRLQSEAKRLKMLFNDGEATQERLEEIFEVPHVHDETIWDAIRLIFRGDARQASVALQAFLQSADVYLAASELSRTLLCCHALSKAADAGRTPAEIFLRFDVKGKRRQDKMIDIASRIDRSACDLSDLAGRLLSLDLAIKQTKTAAGRQEVLLRTLLALCGEPQPAA